jgi:lipoprotein-anchoring transpeptidase ErfK/SrfK
MRAHLSVLLILALVGLPAMPALARPRHAATAVRLDAATIDSAAFERRARKGIDPALIRAAVLLDRMRFSPGVIDGRGGDNIDRAVGAWQRSNGVPETGKLDRETYERLTRDAGPVIMEYEITAGDEKGPYVKKIPPKLEKQAALKRLGYRTVVEMLAERFHMDERLLRTLNPKSPFKEGDRILVADVTRPKEDERADMLEVDKQDRRLRAYSADGKLLASYPASIGSEEKPAPSGRFEVLRIARNPTWTYNPKFAFKGLEVDRPVKLAAGPNNPVGAVWIDLSAETYGIHGTPEPRLVGKSFSHGCVRLTNWDVLDLAALVHKGTKVDFAE